MEPRRTGFRMGALGLTFLGLDFELASALSEGAVIFFVRDRLVKKVQDIVPSIIHSDALSARTAYKLYGVLSFLELGMFSRVGAGGLQTLKERQLQLAECLTSELQGSLLCSE